MRGTAFTPYTAILVVLFGVILFGLTSLAVGWFARSEGVAGPVTELGYGALVGILLTIGIASQLRAAERKIAGLQQAALVAPALGAGSALARDGQNLVPALILVPTLGVLWALHPARGEFIHGRVKMRPLVLAVAMIGGVPLIAYAIAVGGAAQDVVGPPHHVQRLSTMAALAVGILLTGVLAALHTPGWRIPTWSTAAALFVLGAASVLYPDGPGGVGRVWGGAALVGSLLFGAVVEWDARQSGADRLPDR